MPSPIAHGSLALVAVPAAECGRVLPLSRRLALAALCVFWLVLPDLDIAVNLLTAGDGFGQHGGWSHSLVWIVPAGIVFALLARAVFPVNARPSPIRLAIIGALAYLSHVLMDAANWGFGNARGVALLWPVEGERLQSPVPLFVGLRWSEPGDWRAHLLTIGTELAFGLLVLFAVFAVRRVRAGRKPMADDDE